MIRDAQTNLWEAAALAGAGTVVSTNAYDLGAAPVTNAPANDIAGGEPMCVILCSIVGAVNTNGSETYEIDLITSASANLSSPTVVAAFKWTNAQVQASVLAAGTIFILPIPPGFIAQRFLGGQSVLAGAAPTWTITAWIAPMSRGFEEIKKTYGTKITIL